MISKISPKSQCVVTDKIGAGLLLKKTVVENNVPIEVKIVDWTKEYAGELYDTIILSDALAFPELYNDLLKTVRSCAEAECTLYIAYERRYFEKEVEFFRDLGKEWTFELIPVSDLDETWRAPDSIYLYRAQRRLTT